MRIDRDKIKTLCDKKGLRLQDLLDQAEVSKTAYYSLLRRQSVLPGSIHALAHALEVSPSRLLSDETEELKRYERLLAIREEILQRHPQSDPDTVWHTLLALEDDPWTRLDRGLLRGQKFAFHG